MRQWLVRRGGGTALHAGVLGVYLIGSAAYAQTAAGPGALSDMPLPGGIRAAAAQIDDPVAVDRGEFLPDIIRRTYRSSVIIKDDPREAALRPLLAHLEAAARTPETESSTDTLPLPMTPAFWIDSVFAGRATPQTLAAAILSSRGASLLYCGLLSLSDETRAWFAGKPALLTELATKQPAAFMIAAPGLRIINGTLQVPGGKDAEPAWAAVAGRPPAETESFVRALVSRDNGMLAYFFGSLAQLPDPQIRRALDLDAPEPGRRADAAHRLYAVYERLAPGWRIDERTFWRPAVDPALLVADLPVDASLRPVLPGSRRFWAMVFAEPKAARAKNGRDDEDTAFTDGEPVDFVWLCEQVFQGDQSERRRRYQMILFAARMGTRMVQGTMHDAVEAVRAAGAYPALVATLERARLTDLHAYALAADRAVRLSSISDTPRAVRSLSQYQGALALVTRGVLRGGLPGDALPALVTSLSAVETNERGDYDGRLVRWVDGQLLPLIVPAVSSAPVTMEGVGDLYEAAAGPLERDLLRMISGTVRGEPRFIDWEGTRYRVDLAAAEAVRLWKLIGENPKPYLSSARTLAGTADAIAEAGLTRESLRRHADALDRVAQAIGWDRCRDVASGLARAAQDGDIAAGGRLAPGLRLLADDLLARGMKELVYAAALGQPDRSAITADAAASRHDFGLESVITRHSGPWRLPVAGGDSIRGWRVSGSLLGLDVRLAEFSLVRLSARPPKRRPSLNDEDRRVFVEGVALVDAVSLTDDDRDAIADAIRKGRARITALETPADAASLADEVRLSPARRTLLAWVARHEPDRLPAFLSPMELFWLGRGQAPLPPAMQAWGAPAESRTGCLCLQMMDRQPWEALTGRWGSGIFASGFPDLNLRLAELLADMQMPAPLLGPVLAAATLDFINSANSRDEDDRRGLVEYVQALGPERLEQYLALLTTDGPLVPVSESTGRTAQSGVSR